MWRHVGLVTALILYIFIGGLIFHHIEHPVEVRLEQKLANETAEWRNTLAMSVLSLQAFCKAENESVCRKRIDEMLIKYENHINEVKDLVPKEQWRRWGFWSSVFYSGALITTIGYGNVVCRTDTCKAMTMVYAIIGIPLLIIILRLLGKTMFLLVNSIWWKFKNVKHSQRNTSHYRGNIREQDSLPETEDSADVEDQVPLSLALFLCVAYLLVVTAVYSEIEYQWDYFTTLYFIFITVSTIGLGDYVPKYPNYSIVLLAILVVGLSLVSMLVSVTANRFEKHYSGELGCFSSLFSDCFTSKVTTTPHIEWSAEKPSGARRSAMIVGPQLRRDLEELENGQGAHPFYVTDGRMFTDDQTGNHAAEHQVTTSTTRDDADSGVSCTSDRTATTAAS